MTFYAAGSLLMLAAARRNAPGHLVTILLKWMAPFVVPVLILHGILNASFPADYWIFGIVPLRGEGFRFGYDVSLRVFLIAEAGAFWLLVSRDDMVESLFRQRLPTTFVLFAVQGFVVTGVLQRRIASVYLAQRARGIPVDSTILSRIRSVPSILLPVVIGSLVEAEARVPSLLSQGFGALDPLQIPRPMMGAVQKILAAAPLLALLALFMVRLAR